jgi:DNA-directed RNA polymerase sigma subunit (sigma70/sigma32)
VTIEGICRLLRRLRPRQEKVLRLYLGLGCERPHSAQEMAEEFGVSVQVIAGIIGAAQRRLAQEGLTASDLREAARHATKATALRPLVGPSRLSPGTHSHRRSRAR